MINKVISNILPYFPKPVVWQFSKRYIAGTHLEDAIQASKALNMQGMLVTVDLLGEFISTLDQANENTKAYLEIIETFTGNNIKGNFSLKPTSFGLLIDEDVCYKNIRSIVAKAASYQNFVRIDMEDASCTDKELNLFNKLRQEFPKHVGIVLQAYLKRTLSDLENLNSLNIDKPLNIRLCKGIYVESEKVAIKEFESIRKNYVQLLQYCFDHNIYVGIATHDSYLINQAYRLIEEKQISPDQYEFQMLYGVTPALRNSIVSKKHTMRVYVPYGKEWFAYSTRRLKENPSMAGDIIKALFVRG